MNSPEIYPLPKAAFVLREPVKEVRRTVDRKHIVYQMIFHGGRKVRALDRKTLVFLNWAREHREDLSSNLWHKLYENLRQQTVLPAYIDAGAIRASFEQAANQVDARLKILRDLEDSVERNGNGDMVLRGTQVEVHRIASLLSGGMSVEDVCGDYPSLTSDQVVFAGIYAAAHPKPGRPYPKLTAKAAIERVDLSALDLGD